MILLILSQEKGDQGLLPGKWSTHVQVLDNTKHIKVIAVAFTRLTSFIFKNK